LVDEERYTVGDGGDDDDGSSSSGFKRGTFLLLLHYRCTGEGPICGI